MQENEKNQRMSLCLLPAFSVGIYDGTNPCNFASALIFLSWIAFLGRTQRRIFWFGLVFVLTAGFMHFGMALGIFDYFLASPRVLSLSVFIYWAMVLAFSFIGIRDIHAWWKYRRHFDEGSFHDALPGFLHDLKKTDEKAPMTGRTSVNMAFIFLTVLIACAVTLLGSVYPQREYIFIVHSYFSAGGDVPFALWSFFQYSLASVLPLMVVWAGVFGAGSKARGNLKALRLYKVISAALFLGVGIGLGYFLLNYNIVQS